MHISCVLRGLVFCTKVVFLSPENEIKSNKRSKNRIIKKRVEIHVLGARPENVSAPAAPLLLHKWLKKSLADFSQKNPIWGQISTDLLAGQTDRGAFFKHILSGVYTSNLF